MRHGILGETAQSLAAQRLFYDNFEDAVNKSVSLQADIARYQNTLKYARSKLDYSVGKGLYLLSSNMLLKPLNQIIEGFNDKLTVNIDFELGKHYKPVYTKHKQEAHISNHTPAIYIKYKPQAHTQALILAIGGLSLFLIWWI